MLTKRLLEVGEVPVYPKSSREVSTFLVVLGLIADNPSPDSLVAWFHGVSLGTGDAQTSELVVAR